jgi:hypothetical protein
MASKPVKKIVLAKPVRLLAYISGGVLQDVIVEGDGNKTYALEIVDADDRRSSVWWLTAQPTEEYEKAAEDYRSDVEDDDDNANDLCQ